MSVSSLYNNSYANSNASWYGLNMNLLDNTKNSRATANPSSAQTAAGSAYGSGTSSLTNTLASALSTVMNEMNLDSNDKVSFETMLKYRDQLQEKFTNKVKAGLTEMGVDENVTFRLVSYGDGTGIQVITDHADKQLIEKYFRDNPDMVKEFEKIQSLNKLEETRQNQNVDVKAIRERIQMESLTAWFADTSSFMSFNQQGAMLHSGINTLA